jgi:hypothetical protein
LSQQRLDITADALPDGHRYSVSVEKEESASEQKVRLFKEVVTFLLAIIFVSALGFVCVRVVFSTEASADDRKWAMSFLTGIGAGLTGYLIKR